MQMKNIIFLGSILGLAIILTGCGDDTDAVSQQTPPQQVVPQKVSERPLTGGEDFLFGPVVKIFGNVPGLDSSTISVSGKGIYGGGETVRLGTPLYGIHVQTSNGVYVIKFQGDHIYALSSLISVGTIVKFPTKFYQRENEGADGNFPDSDREYDLFGLNNISKDDGQGYGTVTSWDNLVVIISSEPALIGQKQK
jgi:hypothetical protein